MISDNEILNKLHEKVRLVFFKKGFTKLTDPQKLSIPKILEGKNVLIIAPTGSGKTEAALLPIFSQLLKLRDEQGLEKGIYILYITPLRALNRDLLDRISWWCNELNLKVGVRHGDTDIQDRVRQSKDPPHILITTPEMLQAILSGSRLRQHLQKLRWVIVDEIHELVEDKRGTQLAITLEKLKWLVSRKLQIIGLSATVGDPETVGKFLVGNDGEIEIIQIPYIRQMELDVIRPSVNSIDEELSKKLMTHPEVISRLRIMKDLIDKYGSTIVFVNTRSIAELLTFRFNLWNPEYPISVHHSSLSKISRVGVERAFKEGKLKAVIATSSLELGIDIGHVNLVIQYMSPHQVTRLVQRVGRSGHRLDKIPRGYIITDDVNDTLEAIVITKFAKEGKLEHVKIPEKPYDVLCNQIVSLLMLKNTWKIEELYKLIKNAYPYRNLTIEELIEVLRFMSDHLNPRLVYFDERRGIVTKPIKKRARREMYRYFFSNLSMIPDEKQYYVINMVSNEPIGILDESFVAEYGIPGIKFVFRGRVWILQRIIDDKIFVTEASDPHGAIPSWIGEEIPVPYEIAQEVGKIKKFIAELYRNGFSKSEIIKKLQEIFNINTKTLEFVVDKVIEHVSQGYPIPSHDTILIEKYNDIFIIHVHFGTLVNKTLARLLSELISEEFGISIGVQQDAYAIVIQSKYLTSINEVVKILYKLCELNSDELVRLIHKVANKSGLFKRRFVHVARRFNVIPKDIDLSDVNLSSLIEALRDTPVYVEALKEFLTKDLDIQITCKVLDDLRNGFLEILTIEVSEPTPLGKEILDKISSRLELIAPERLNRLIFESLKIRLLNDSNVLLCTNCYWYTIMRNKDLDEDIKCPNCNSKRIAILKLDEDKLKNTIQKLKASKHIDEDIRRRIEVSSKLVEKFGKLAVIALSSKLDVKLVEKILEKVHSIDELVQEIQILEKEELKRRLLS